MHNTDSIEAKYTSMLFYYLPYLSFKNVIVIIKRLPRLLHAASLKGEYYVIN